MVRASWASLSLSSLPPSFPCTLTLFTDVDNFHLSLVGCVAGWNLWNWLKWRIDLQDLHADCQGTMVHLLQPIVVEVTALDDVLSKVVLHGTLLCTPDKKREIDQQAFNALSPDDLEFQCSLERALCDDCFKPSLLVAHR